MDENHREDIERCELLRVHEDIVREVNARMPEEEILYDLAELTGNPMWAERAHAAWVNGADGISDGTLVVDGRPTPYGGQHEARFMEETYHGVFHWLVAWPSAFRLVNLRRTLPVIGDRPGRRL